MIFNLVLLMLVLRLILLNELDLTKSISLFWVSITSISSLTESVSTFILDSEAGS